MFLLFRHGAVLGEAEDFWAIQFTLLPKKNWIARMKRAMTECFWGYD